MPIQTYQGNDTYKVLTNTDLPLTHPDRDFVQPIKNPQPLPKSWNGPSIKAQQILGAADADPSVAAQKALGNG